MDIINNLSIKILNDFENTYKFVENIALTNFLKCNLNEIPHLIFYGPDGSFKDYYIYYLIKKLTGNYNINLNQVLKKISVNNNVVEFNVLESTNYIEINLSNYGFYDRWIIIDYIQKIIEMRHYIQNRHIILLQNIDKISYNAFMALRRIMEKYVKNALFIFSAKNLSHVNDAIKSRTFMIRCPLQNDKSFKLFLSNYIKDKTQLKNTIAMSKRNINKAILLQYNNNFANDFVPILENQIKNHFAVMKKTKDVFSIAKLNREFLYTILNFNYEHTEIIKSFINNFMNYKKINNEKMFEVVKYSAELDHEIVKSSKDNYCFEKYLLKLYKIIHY